MLRLLALAVAALLTACSGFEDNGLIKDDARPMVMPWRVTVDESIDLAQAEEAIHFWESSGTVDGLPPSWFQLWHEEQAPGDPGSVYLEIGYVSDHDPSDDYEPGGRAILEWTAVDEIRSCHIIISSDIAYHEATVQTNLRHELGHCLGLADDPSSLDLDSIMSSPRPGSMLTEHDRVLLP